MVRGLATIAGVLLALAAGAGVLGFFLMQPERIVAAVVAGIEARTGQKVTHAPAVVSFFPAPVLTLGDFRLGGAAPLIKAKALRLSAGYLALLQGSADAAQATLVQPRIEIAIDADGDTGWGGALAPVDTLPAFAITLEDGTLAFLDQRSGAAFEATGIDALIRGAAADGPVTLRGSLSLARQHTRFEAYVKAAGRIAAEGSPASFTLDGPSLKAGFDGRISAVRGLNLAGQVSAQVKDLRNLGRWAGVGLPELPALNRISLTGALDAAPGSIAIEKAVFSLGAAKAAGDIAFSRQKGRPAVTAVLAVTGLDALPLAAALLAQRGAPMDFSVLQAFDGSLRINADPLLIGGSEAGRAEAQAFLANGVLDMQLPGLVLFGGKANARIVIDGAAAEPALRLAFNGSGLDVAALLAQTGSGAMSGSAALALTVALRGKTLDEMAGSLKGTAEVSVTDGALNGISLKALLAAAGRGPLDGVAATPGAATAFSALKASFRIADGIAASAAITLSADGVAVKGAGEIDVLRRAVDVTFTGTLDGKPLPTPLVVKGAWQAPRIAAGAP